MRLLMAAQWRTVIFSLSPLLTSSPHTSTSSRHLHQQKHTHIHSPSVHQLVQPTSPSFHTAQPLPGRRNLGPDQLSCPPLLLRLPLPLLAVLQPPNSALRHRSCRLDRERQTNLFLGLGFTVQSNILQLHALSRHISKVSQSRVVMNSLGSKVTVNPIATALGVKGDR